MLLLSCFISALLAAPAWVPSPRESKWIQFGGENGIAAEHGITIRPAGSEGTLTPAVRAGRPCAQSLRNRGRMGYFYFKTEPWDEFRDWLGGRDLLLTIHYFDGARGKIQVAYDSSDPRVHKPPYPPGVWKQPPEFSRGVPLEGDKAWKTVQMRLPLAFFNKRVHGADFRLNTSGCKDCAMAGVALSRVEPAAETEQPSFTVIENSRCRLEVDGYGIRRIANPQSGLCLAGTPFPHPSLFMLHVKKPGPARLVPLDLYSGKAGEVRTFEDEKGAPRLEVHHQFENGIGAVVHCQLQPNGQSVWNLELTNHSDLEIAEIRFPVIAGCQIGEAGEDDRLFVPKYWGQVRKKPNAWGPVHSYWGTAMRWCALWDDQACLYLGIEDTRSDDYGFDIGSDARAVTLAPRQRIRARPGAVWRSGTYRLALTGGGWHEAADIYRDFVARTLQPAEVPPHVRWNLDAWSAQHSNRLPADGWDAIVNTGASNSERGIYFMPANRQMLDGADSGYCGLFPYPSPVWGSTREFSQKLAILRSLGGMYTPYLNFHLWAPGYGHFPRIGTFPKFRLPKGVPLPDDDWYERNRAVPFDGRSRNLESDLFAQTGMAVPSPGWQQWLEDWTRRYLEWGTDGMYYDQFNMIYLNGKLYPGYDSYGCWMRATLDTITRIRRTSRARNPYFTASGEFCLDVYGQQLDLHMTSGVFNRLEFFHYCNPRQILIDGAWNGGLSKAFGGWERERFIWQVGARFEHLAGDAKWQQTLLRLRRAVKSLLYDAEFQDTVGLSIRDSKGQPVEPEYPESRTWEHAPCRGVSARWFLYRHGPQEGAVINIINTPLRKDARLAIDTRAFGPVRYAFAFTFDGKRSRIEGRQKDNSFTFDVPASEMSSVVLNHRLPPVVEWQLDPVAAPGISATLHLRATNVNRRKCHIQTSLLLPPGWKAVNLKKKAVLKPGETREWDVEFSIPRGAKKKRHDIRCVLKSPQGDFTTYNFISVNDPVLVDFRGGPGSYHLWLRNLTKQALAGTARFHSPAPLRTEGKPSFTVPPDSTVEIPILVTGRERLQEIAEVSAAVEVAGVRKTVVRGVIPVTPNRGFETDSAGDGKPDWWMARDGREKWAYERIHLSQDAHSGRSALQIGPPQPGERFICAYPVHSALKPGSVYRFTAWIKARSSEGVYAYVFGRKLGQGKTGNEWRKFSAEFKTPPGRTYSFYRLLYNRSPAPALFDDLRVEEVIMP